MKTIKPYANDARPLAFGDLTIENRVGCVAPRESIDLIRDKEGLAYPRARKNGA